jgi:hypothetical protein
MYKKADKILVYITFILLTLSAYLTFKGTWLANDINHLQMQWMSEKKFYPILTMGILFIPPMLILLPLKLFIKKKVEKEKRTFSK